MKQLNVEFSVMCCYNGNTALELLGSFEPDVLLLDMTLPGVDGMQVLQALRLSGRNTRVLATIPVDSDYLLAQLGRLQVDHICRRPCQMESLLCSLRQMAMLPNLLSGGPEIDLDNMLLQLSFRMGFAMYSNTYTAIMMTYEGNITGGLMKGLYPAIAQPFGGTAQQVEKSIRDAIHRAYKNGNRAVWRMYLGPCVDEQCPSNELFISRLARLLQLRYGTKAQAK